MEEFVLELGEDGSELYYVSEGFLRLCLYTEVKMSIAQAFDQLLERFSEPVIKSVVVDLGSQHDLTGLPCHLFESVLDLQITGSRDVDVAPLLSQTKQLENLVIRGATRVERSIPSLMVLSVEMDECNGWHIDLTNFPNIKGLILELQSELPRVLESNTVSSLSLYFKEQSSLNLDLLKLPALESLTLEKVKALEAKLLCNQLKQVVSYGSLLLEECQEKFPAGAELIDVATT
ncbi:hypothetical protein SAMN02745181_3672 [Rubritalea squalenifaciens DSM 18772]|uniref:Cyclic nucleotide-binding domain-containing protein n=1 Tax=Rubritalea squalenifaciens DSM 18772 TaxID=1123071 RepID=A0A1M6RS54_9BACT|nr:hypothetical protein [Rubritalea squalenifaciens]SHK35352.1 hypothetical protein SAMN02745181_3672 [Rubritalea squalenifaciens DSM 18772]